MDGKNLIHIINGLGSAGFYKLNLKIQMSRNHGNHIYPGKCY